MSIINFVATFQVTIHTRARAHARTHARTHAHTHTPPHTLPLTHTRSSFDHQSSRENKKERRKLSNLTFIIDASNLDLKLIIGLLHVYIIIMMNDKRFLTCIVRKYKPRKLPNCTKLPVFTDIHGCLSRSTIFVAFHHCLYSGHAPSG